MKFVCSFLTFCLMLFCFSVYATDDTSQLVVRIAKVKVDPKYLDEYLEFVKENGKVSVEKEDGVISLFPMQDSEDPTNFSIVEIYRNQEAYQQHIKTDHFQRYKTETLKMVMDLQLVEMQVSSPELLPMLFKKY